jgi:L-lactate dehydrogenase
LPEKTAPIKIVIIGAGFVGTTFAYSLILHGLVSDIVLIDADKDRAEGEAMDLSHGIPYAYPTRISIGDFDECRDADIVTIAVDVGKRIHRSRLELAGDNFQILKEIVPKIVEYNKECILLVVTNPLDVMTHAALKLSGFPKNRVIGSGTILDSARLRFLLSEKLQIDPRNVHAYVIGEHGDSEVPVWSLANVAGINLKEYCPICGIPYSAIDLDEIFVKVRDAAYEVIKRKGRTNYAVALGLTRIVQAIVRDENAVLTVSSLLDGYHGVNDVCLSVPAVVNRSGIRELIKLPLDEKEMNDFHRSASIIKEVTTALGL